MGIFTSNFTFVPFLSIVVYGLLGNSVTPDKAFFAVVVYNVMTEIMMYFVPNAAACIGELVISIGRMQVSSLLEIEHEKDFSRSAYFHEDACNIFCVLLKQTLLSLKYGFTFPPGIFIAGRTRYQQALEFEA